MRSPSIKDNSVSTRAVSRFAAPLLVALSFGATAAHAEDATWNLSPVSNDYNTPTNWTPAAAPIGPSGTATFANSSITSLTFSTGTTVDSFQFNPGAPAYTFGLNGHFLEFTGNGIVNDSANAPTINAFGMLQFDNTATAGNAIINNTPGSTIFTGFSTAGTATITNSGGGLLSFTDFSNAASATITTNAGSITQFTTNSDGAQARFITNAGGTVDFSGTTGLEDSYLISAGSIEGAGTYNLGQNRLSVGGNNLSTVVSGTIGGGNASLLKEGTGTLTLSGVNTYTGGTSINGGTLLIAGAGTLGATTAPLSIGGGTLDLGGSTQTTGAMSMFGGSLVNGALNSASFLVGGGLISATLIGSGAVTQDGDGTTTLAAANTYAGGTEINSGTLQAAHASAGVVDALGSGAITINNAGALRSGVSGTLGNGITFNDSSLGMLSAAAGTTLTLAGGISLNPDSVTTFGTPTDTGTILMNPSGISASTTASAVVGGGILRAGSFQLGSALGTIQSTTVNAGATLDLNDFSAAIHNFAGAGSVVTGTFGNTNLSLFIDPATSSEFSGVTSGGGQVTVSGGGTMILSGDNTYGNGTSIMAGTTLQVGNGGATGSIIGNVRDGGTLVFNRSNTITFAGVISDFSGDGPASAGSLAQNGTGTTILTANNTYTGGTTINAGTLQLGNGGTIGSILGNVLNNGAFAINRSDAFAFGGVISGTGALQQMGAGTTTLSAVQTYTGSTTISAGVLALTGTASIAASSGVAAEAKFDISGLSAGTSITNLSGGSAGTVALGNNTLTLTNAAGAFAGAITGNGGLVKQGSGLFTLSGVNDYTGLTTVAGGNLRVNGSVASAVTVQSGATLSGIGSVGGLVTVQSGGTLSAGQSPGTITLGALNLNAGSTSVFELGSPGIVGGATNDLVNVTGNLTLGGTLSVDAPSAGYYRLFNYGTMTPSDFATITGSTNGDPTVLTNVPNQVNLSIAAAGQRIQFWDGADQTGNGVVNGGTGTWNATNANWTGAPGQAAINDQWRSSVGVFSGAAGTVTVVGTQAFDTLQFGTTGYVLNPGAGGQLQLSGLSGTGTINTDGGVAATINTPIFDGSSQTLTKVGGGTLILTATNSYTGGTTISGGALQLGNGGATGSIIGDVVDNGVLAFSRSNTYDFGGSIAGSGSLQVLGGFVGLTGANTFSGGTTISSGVLALGSVAFGGQAGGTSGSLSGNVNIGGNSGNLNNQLWFTRTDNTTFAGDISGSGLIAKFGPGTLTLTGSNATGGTVIWNGTVQIGNGGTAGSLAGGVSFLGNNSTLRFNRSDTFLFIDFIGSGGFVEQTGTGRTIFTGNLLGSPLTISAGTFQVGNGGTTGSLGTGTITDDSVLAFNHTGALQVSNAISGTGRLQKDGAGTTILTGDNTYSGGTTIAAGVLQLGSGDTTGSIVGNVTDSSVFAINRSNASVYNGVISGSGAFQQIGTGTTTLSAEQSYSGLTTITAGTLALAGAGSIASSSGVVANSAFDISGLSGAGTSIKSLSGSGSVALGTKTLTLTNASGNFAGSIDGSGGLTLAAGTQLLSGVNGYTGATTITAGTLALAGAGSIANSSGVVANGAFDISGLSGAGTSIKSLSGSGSVALGTKTLTLSNASGNFAGSIDGSGGLTLAAGTQSLSGVNSYTGQTTIVGGSLALSGAGNIANSSGVLTNGTFDISAVFGAGTSIKTLSGSGDVALGAKTLTLTTASGNFGGVIGGSGGFALAGGSEILFGVNTYTGTTGISAGTLALSGIGDIAGSSGVIANGAFDISQIAGAGRSIQTLSGSGSVALGAKTLTLTNASGNFAGSIGGTGSFTFAGGAETLSGTNTYTGGTTISAGTLTIAASGSITSNVNNNAAFNNAGTVTGSLTNAGTATNSGTIGNGLNNNAGTTTNSGTINGGATVVGGTLNTNTATSVINGSLTNSATVNAQNQVNGAIVNQGAGVFNVVGNLAANSSFTNNDTAQLAVTGGNFTGITTLTNSSTSATGIAVSAGRTLSANAINNNAGAFISNSGTLTSFGGPVNNAGTLNSNAAASILSGGLTNTGTVNAQNQVNGAIVNQGAGAFSVAGNLAGNNSFTNNGTAQLLVDSGNFTGITALTNNSTNATGIAVSVNRTLSTTGIVTNAAGANIAVNGTFTAGQLLTNSGVVLVNSGGTLNATVGGITNTATGTITVALGGTVNDDLNNAGVVTNNGAYNAIVATDTGTISNGATGVWTGNVLSNTAAISNSGLWIGTIANAGTFNNNSGATVSGLLTNTGGTTTNNGALNGGAIISGGAFKGAGTVTNLTVSGGTFAPGTGTPGSSMTVTGNLAFQSGAMYLVTLNPTTASFASVGGTASLNGSAAAVYLAGSYVSKKYTILTAAGGVGGTFGSLVNTNVPTNFTSSLSYDANHAYIDLTLNFIPNPAPNFGGGLNINQQNIANTLVNFFNTTGGIPLVFGTLTPTGLTIASGELGTGVIQSSIKANDMFLNLLLDPSVAGRAGGFAPATGASQFLAEDEALAYRAKASSAERAAYAMATKASLLAPQPVNRWSVWGAAYGGSALTDGNALVGSHDTTARAYGVAAGSDYKVSPDVLIGFALAGGGTSYSIADALGTGRSDLFQAGAFGRQNIGAAYLSAALAYGWQDVTTNRTVALAGADVLEGRFKAETFSGRFEGGYRIATPWAGLAPYVASQVISFNLPAYAERTLAGAGTFALNYAGQTTTATRTELGLRADRSFAMQDGIFTLRGRAAWAHDYNNDRAVTAIFQTLPGASFIVNGARPNPDGALVSAGAEMKWINGFSLAATFEGEFSGNTTSYAGKGVAKYTW
jgi:autotransporter-associated beta strand protein